MGVWSERVVEEGEGGVPRGEEEQGSMEGVEGELEDEGAAQEFVEKEFIARPGESATMAETIEEVKLMQVGASR